MCLYEHIVDLNQLQLAFSALRDIFFCSSVKSVSGKQAAEALHMVVVVQYSLHQVLMIFSISIRNAILELSAAFPSYLAYSVITAQFP